MGSRSPHLNHASAAGKSPLLGRQVAPFAPPGHLEAALMSAWKVTLLGLRPASCARWNQISAAAVSPVLPAASIITLKLCTVGRKVVAKSAAAGAKPTP